MSTAHKGITQTRRGRVSAALAAAAGGAVVAGVILATTPASLTDPPREVLRADELPAELAVPAVGPTGAATGPCADLAGPELRDLTWAVAEADRSAEARSRVRQAADLVRRWEAELGPDATAAADGLARIASGTSDPAVLDSTGAAASALDEKVSTLCRAS